VDRASATGRGHGRNTYAGSSKDEHYRRLAKQV